MVLCPMPIVLQSFDGGPVVVHSRRPVIGEERGITSDVTEVYLYHHGFTIRTARRRVATRSAYLHFGLTPPVVERGTLGLFES